VIDNASARVKVQELLRAHDATCKRNALRDNLGDGYLYAHNKLYANVRDVVLLLGFRFNNQPSKLWGNYHAFPLTSLDRILTQRTIPYLNNVTPFRDLLRVNAEFEMPRSMFYTIKKNYLLHESAHCISYKLIRGYQKSISRVLPQQQFVLSALLSESFANAIELLASSFIDREPQLLFFHMNSYITYSSQGLTELRSVVSQWGLEETLKFCCFAYLLANLCHETASEATIDKIIHRIWHASTIDADSRSLFHEIFKYGFILNPVFRVDAGFAYFQMSKTEQEFERIKTLDLVDEPVISEILMVFDMLADVASKGSQCGFLGRANGGRHASHLPTVVQRK
jgi:hypothetical protein